jgi:hypothetical protein
MLVPLIICSVALVGLCFWQIVEKGGAKWLFGGTKESEKNYRMEMGERV